MTAATQATAAATQTATQTAPQTPRVGNWLHTFHPDGQVKYQGKVLAVGSAYCVVGLRSFLSGAPNGVARLPRVAMADPAKVRLYESAGEMRAAYARSANSR